MRREDYAALGGHMGAIVEASEALKKAGRRESGHGDTPGPLHGGIYRWGQEGSETP